MEQIDFVLQSADGPRYVMQSNREKRPDVAEYFKNPALVDAGFSVSADLSTLKGAFELKVIYRQGGETFECSSRKVDIVIIP